MSIFTPHAIAAGFADATKGYPALHGLDFSRLMATKNVIMERPDGRSTLSKAVWNACFPLADTDQEYFHFTSVDALRGILQSGELWLFSVLKRLAEHELVPFAQQHGLEGYTTNLPTGQPALAQMAEDLFYVSLTTAADPAYMSIAFGHGKPGVRLRLRVRPVLQRSDIRQMAYADHNSASLFKVLQDIARQQFGRHLVLDQLSRAVAFLLPESLRGEAEIRLMVKRFRAVSFLGEQWVAPNCWPTRRAGEYEYLPLSILRDNNFCSVRLLGVDTCDQGTVGIVESMLEIDPAFHDLPVRMV